MRKLIFGINLTLDGCCDHTKGVGYDDLHDFYARLILDTDTFVYGRKTYELMVPFWPDVAKHNSGPAKSINDFAQAFVTVRNIIVFSKTLTQTGVENAIIKKDLLRDEILQLKMQEGKSILTGGVDIPGQLAQLGLVDEYYFVVQPLLAGKGRRLFDDIDLRENLQFVESHALKSGCVALRYARNPD